MTVKIANTGGRAWPRKHSGELIFGKRKTAAAAKKKQSRARAAGRQNTWNSVRDVRVATAEGESVFVEQRVQMKGAAAALSGGWGVLRPGRVVTEYPRQGSVGTIGNALSRVKKECPEVKEKHYIGVVKEVNETHVLAEINPRGDADSWEVYLYMNSFKGRQPEVSDEFECTLTTHGSWNALDIKLLRAEELPTTRDFGIDEKELLAFAANLNV